MHGGGGRRGREIGVRRKEGQKSDDDAGMGEMWYLWSFINGNSEVALDQILPCQQQLKNERSSLLDHIERE